jgi:hypothetical protein
LAAKIPDTGFFGIAAIFLAAILEVLPPSPAHLMIGLGLADCDRIPDRFPNKFEEYSILSI